MIAKWPDEDTYEVPDLTVEDHRKKTAATDEGCKNQECNVMWDVHVTNGKSYRMHWKKDRSLLLVISHQSSQKTQVVVKWFGDDENDAKGKAKEFMKKLFDALIKNELTEDDLMAKRDAMLKDIGITPPAPKKNALPKNGQHPWPNLKVLKRQSRKGKLQWQQKSLNMLTKSQRQYRCQHHHQDHQWCLQL
eukprot:12031332-Karenia_brevis.AAC.1